MQKCSAQVAVPAVWRATRHATPPHPTKKTPTNTNLRPTTAMSPLHRSLLLSTARPSRHLNCFFALSPFPSPSSSSLPFLYPSRPITYNGGFDPEEMPGQSDEEDIPFEHDLSPKLPASAPSQKVALAVSDPWAFLQGATQKTSTYQVPYSRPIPRTGAFPPPRLPAQFADQREKDGAAGPGPLTEREREIFTRIFESILSEHSTFTPRVPPMQSHPSMSLNALFESAVGPQQSGSEISFGPSDLIDKNSAAESLALASSFEQYPAALRAAAAKASGLVNPSRKLQVEELRSSRSITGLLEEMHMCETDLALGQWMEDRVFCLIKDGRLQTTTPDYLPGSYAFLLAEGMGILRKTFNDFTGCLAIFERVKKLGAESYVLGCSVDVYNQAIAAKWEAYRDLYKIKELVEEMDINGIQGDKKTVRLIHNIMDDVAAMDYSENSVAHAMFMEGNEDMLSHLNYKADVWDVPETGPIEESLSMLV